MSKKDVLDVGYVRLVDSMGSDLSIVRAARVSYNADWRVGESDSSDEKLLNYLWKHQHTSPFESVTLTFEVLAPIFVIRQWQRHRTWSFNEVSGRYKEMERLFYIPDPSNVGKQSAANKQGRELDDNLLYKRVEQCAEVSEHCNSSFDLYEGLLSSDWPRELARVVLPLNTYTRMFCTVNLLNLFKFLNLRCSEHSQYEIREYANAMKELTKELVAPRSVTIWEKYR